MSRGFLLDTNIPSEQTKPRPDPRPTLWLDSQPRQSVFISALTIGELRYGLALMPEGSRRTAIEWWLDSILLPMFSGRVIPVTQAIAERWGALTAMRRLAGKPLQTADGLIAATALEHDCTLVTRNLRDFAGLGLALLNPWEL